MLKNKRREGIPGSGDSISRSWEEPSPRKDWEKGHWPVCLGQCSHSSIVREGPGGEVPTDGKRRTVIISK